MKYSAFITPIAAEGESEHEAVQQFFRSCDVAHRNGYHSVWLTEHHFSSYHPVPDPFVMLSHVAARCPGMGVGTGVLVTPWHQPLRLAGQIASLSNITDAPIYIGMGRGNAPMEYEAFGVDQNYAKEQFAEIWEILQLAMTGDAFTFHGKQYQVPQPLRVHPRPRMDNVIFYGAVGQPASAGRIGELGLALMTNPSPPAVLREVVRNWSAAAEGKINITATPRVVAPWVIIADTDEEAQRLAVRYIGAQLRVASMHYAMDKDKKIRGFEYMSESAYRQLFTADDAAIQSFIKICFVGTPEMVAEQWQAVIDAGFDHLLVNVSLPFAPHELRREWLSRFVDQVVPLMAKQPVAMQG